METLGVLEERLLLLGRENHSSSLSSVSELAASSLVHPACLRHLWAAPTHSPVLLDESQLRGQLGSQGTLPLMACPYV